MRWRLNGQAATVVPADDRGLMYGDGLFETIAVRDGVPRFFEEHVQRFESGCHRLGLPLVARQRLQTELQEALRDASCGVLKLVYTRGSSARGYRAPAPEAVRPTLLVGYEDQSLPKSPLAGVTVRYCQTRIGRSPATAGIKTLNRLEQVLARNEWRDEQYAEGLMLNDRGEVICGTMSNVFAVIGGKIITPAVDESGIAGVMRHKVLELAGTMAETGVLRCADLEQADDVFLTNSLIGMWPIKSLGDSRYRRSALTLDLRRSLAEIGVIECAD